ncbi:hypothetical protein TRVL_08169 [Trypanosoma vivax]|nr:hypothetical protein TRVL_08169 [Trypanosoma vivax]
MFYTQANAVVTQHNERQRATAANTLLHMPKEVALSHLVSPALCEASSAVSLLQKLAKAFSPATPPLKMHTRAISTAALARFGSPHAQHRLHIFLLRTLISRN